MCVPIGAPTLPRPSWPMTRLVARLALRQPAGHGIGCGVAFRVLWCDDASFMRQYPRAIVLRFLHAFSFCSLVHPFAGRSHCRTTSGAARAMSLSGVAARSRAQSALSCLVAWSPGTLALPWTAPRDLQMRWSGRPVDPPGGEGRRVGARRPPFAPPPRPRSRLLASPAQPQTATVEGIGGALTSLAGGTYRLCWCSGLAECESSSEFGVDFGALTLIGRRPPRVRSRACMPAVVLFGGVGSALCIVGVSVFVMLEEAGHVHAPLPEPPPLRAVRRSASPWLPARRLPRATRHRQIRLCCRATPPARRSLKSAVLSDVSQSQALMVPRV